MEFFVESKDAREKWKVGRLSVDAKVHPASLFEGRGQRVEFITNWSGREMGKHGFPVTLMRLWIK
jgi:hypothetical protein